MVSRLDPPEALIFVVDLLNTVDLRTHGPAQGLVDRDQLKDAKSTRAWLINQGRLAEGASTLEEVARELRTLRDDLRKGLAGGGFSRRCEFQLVFGHGDRKPSLRSERDGAEGLVAEVVADLVAVAMSPAWTRLRICAAPDCRWAFFDSSRNGRARWCSMKTCGNRMKTRAYRQRRTPLPTQRPMPRPDSRSLPRRRGVFRLDGDYWSIAHAGRTFRLRDTKGLRYIARLLAEPNREVHVLDLVSTADVVGPRSKGEESLSAVVSSNDAPLLDHAARDAYRLRLEDLKDEVDEAERWNDTVRAASARDEIEFLASELRRAVGLRGRDRTFASDSERARVSVTRVIKAALSRISDESPELKHHFASTLRTGTYCSYSPDPRLPVDWEL